MNTNLLDKVRNMSEEDIYKAVYTDFLTDTLNRRALEEDEYQQIAIIDMDSLKWVNDNLDHGEGNKLLVELTVKLKFVFGDQAVYRLGGDEFAVTCNYNHCELDLLTRLQALREVYPKFSYGVASTLEQADSLLNLDKQARELSGERAPRGCCPPWL